MIKFLTVHRSNESSKRMTDNDNFSAFAIVFDNLVNILNRVLSANISQISHSFLLTIIDLLEIFLVSRKHYLDRLTRKFISGVLALIRRNTSKEKKEMILLV